MLCKSDNCCCANILRATSVTQGTGTFVFETENTITPVNNGKYIFKCPVSLLPTSAITAVEQVYVSLGETQIPLQCKLGNNVFSDQIRCFNVDNCNNIVLRLTYGSTPAHFKIVNQGLCCSQAYGLTADTETTSG